MIADIDGTQIPCQLIRWRPVLSEVATAVIRYRSGHYNVQPGQEMHLYESGSLLFSGEVRYPQAVGDANTKYTEVNASSHLVHLQDRMCKTSIGNLITPGNVLTDNLTAPAILAAFINNTTSFDPGSYRLSVGSVAGGGIDVSGAPMNFPMNIEQMRAILVGTGQLDVFENPGIGSSSLDFTNGDGGNDLSGSVSYEYATGAHNAAVGQVTVDMSEVNNAIWYLLGPRISRTRWKGSITPTAPHVGGTWPAALLARIALSRANYDYRQEIQVFDEQDANDIRPLYESRWASEAFLRAVPRTFLSVKPKRGIFPNFAVGDLISVAANINGSYSGAQRVYSFEVQTDQDGVNSITEILTSADQEP